MSTRMSSYHVETDETHDEQPSPERRLFRNVLMVAILDAIDGNVHCKKGTERERSQESAASWLINGGRDFELVCECSGLDPASTRKAAMEYVELMQAKRKNAGTTRYHRPRRK